MQSSSTAGKKPGAAPMSARAMQSTVDLDERQQPLDELGPDLAPSLGPPVDQRRLSLRVGEARRRTHDGRIKACRLQRAAMRDDHVCGEAQPLDPRCERAQMIRERGR